VTTMLSVVIACRNAEDTLGVQLEALARQECPVPWDVVISDNGSTDRSVAIARAFASRLPGLTIVDSSDRAGAGHARNIGAYSTQAPLLVFCDADDEAAPGWLAAMVNALKHDQFVAGSFESQKLNGPSALRSRSLQQSTALQESPFGPGLPHAGAGNLGLSRELFFSVGGFDLDVGYLEDTDLCWRIQLTGVPLVFCPEAVMHVRLRSSLRTMWVQGRAYGAASALLEHRYQNTVPSGGPTGPITSKPGPRTAGPRFGAFGRVISLIREQQSLGGLLWTLGWHVGHRQWRPAHSPVAAQPLAPPSRQTS
jgi:cellulose synthase/poly-beta-1,6-N-acetylglucosamine synthase-like glycosyltransferase